MTNPEKFGGMYDGGEPNGGDGGIAGAGHPSDAGAAGGGDEFKVPEEFAEKGWTKDLKSYEDLWKKTDGAQSLIGQKAYPDVNSTPEQWGEFYKELGRPDEAKGYNFNRDGFSEDFRKNQSEEYDSAVKAIFHKAGLNQKQVDVIQPEVEQLTVKIQEGLAAKDAKADLEFDELASKTFGVNRDQILADSKILLKELAPEGFGEKISGLDNETLVILSGVLKNVRDKYITEDGSGGGGTPLAGETIDDLRQKARTIMQSDEYRNSFNTKSGESRKEVALIYEKIAKMSA